jgi:hypothetical protein
VFGKARWRLRFMVGIDQPLRLNVAVDSDTAAAWQRPMRVNSRAGIVR